MKRRSPRTLLVVALAIIAGCSKDVPTQPWIGGWVSARVTFDDGVVRTEAVTYSSGGLLIKGLVTRPVAFGRRPVLVLNHGGFAGLDQADTTRRAAARQGWAVIESSYRGEDGSDGQIEVSLGEVDDVIAMIRVALDHSWADSSRVLMLGGSHGGAITLRAIQKGAPVQAAVALFPPTDWAACYRFWRDALAAHPPPADSAAYVQLIDLLEEVTGGPPETHAAGYAARSAMTDPGFISAWPHPLMVLQGTDDRLVPLPEACMLAAATGGFASWYVDLAGNTLAGAPAASCAGLTWSGGTKPSPSWPNSRYLIVYEDLDHEVGTEMASDAVTFLAAKLPPQSAPRRALRLDLTSLGF